MDVGAAQKDAPPPKVDPPAKPAKPPVFVVAKGHSVTTLRGQLNEGDPIAARDFPPKSVTFETLRKANVIVEKK